MKNPNKPKKNTDELIGILKQKGVTFSLIDEEQAKIYLEKNNYLRTASYRRNFEKKQKGTDAGKYLDLDFGYLAELSSIDKQLREILLTMCIDVEHAIKASFIHSIESNSKEDGYNIVDLFLKKYPKITEDIENKISASFTDKLINTYFSICYVYYNDLDNKSCNRMKLKIYDSHCPVWVLVELISFGDLLKLVSFYNEQYPEYEFQLPKFNEISPIKSLRNACAHNNCLLNDMRSTDETRPTGLTVGFIQKMNVFSPKEIKKKLSCRPLFEIVSLLYFYKVFVSRSVYEREIDNLRLFVNERMFKHIDYFSNCKLVETSFEFFKKTLDNL